MGCQGIAGSVFKRNSLFGGSLLNQRLVHTRATNKSHLHHVQPFFAPVQPQDAPVQEAFRSLGPDDLLHPLLTTFGHFFPMFDPSPRRSGLQYKRSFGPRERKSSCTGAQRGDAPNAKQTGLYQGKTKGQQLKRQNRFIIFHSFSHFFRLFHNFSPRTFPFKTKGFSSRRTKEKKR